ncbi:hypothetical protein BOH78_2776 [Pichia kudriavzevii]|uniref:Uncharacterized protein n=1 Tax=Pichia kudriavzevii TaxID=4909 RepID=A0A1V2LMG0_PICKU|nr:hypothetical protein BOH78_2776 [Pichia kudriavzevii]
MAINQFTNNRI